MTDQERTRDLEEKLANLEQRYIMLGDVISNHCMAMQSAVIAGHLESPAHGLQWIVNTLSGPGLLPDLEFAKALGGAQAWFDHEARKHEAFRAGRPEVMQ